MRQHGRNRICRAEQVRVDHPGKRIGLQRPRFRIVPRDPGIGDHNVYPAEFRAHRLGSIEHRVRIRHIGSEMT